MATLKGSKTEHNLLAAFAGESQARNRYSFAASIARKEGYEQISGIFLETADNEKEHAKVFFIICCFQKNATDLLVAFLSGNACRKRIAVTCLRLSCKGSE